MKLCKFSEPDYKDVIETLVNRSNKDLFVQDEAVRKILNDVKEKWVSLEAARDIYGVEISADGTLNEPVTKSLRDKMA